MKRSAYILFTALVITVCTKAQTVITAKGTKTFVDTSKWTLSGSNIYNKNSGSVGIGSTTIPKGGIGIAKFGIDGTTGSSAGPHIQYTTSSDNYPLFQQLNWGHDNTALCFDCYFDGISLWRSSTTSGGNFRLYKWSGILRLEPGNTNTQGSNITFATGLYMDVTGKVGIGNAFPNQKFEVTGTNAQPSALNNSVTNATFRISGNSNNTIDFGTYANSPLGGYIQAHNTTAATAMPLVINPSGGNLGVGVNNPLSRIESAGSFGTNITTTSSNLTLDDTHATVVITSGTPTITLPSVSASTRREYVIVNKTSTARTLAHNGTDPVLDFSGAAITSIAANSSIILQSDGTSWHQVITSFASSSIDATNDAFVNNSANTRVELGTNADGTTARTTGTEFVITDNGSVGIGTTSPSWKLDVQGTSAIGQIKRIITGTPNQAAGFLFTRSRGSVGAETDIGAGDFLGKIQFRGRVGGSDLDYGSLMYKADGTTAGSGHYAFTKADLGTEIMSIRSDSSTVGIGTSNPTTSSALEVASTTKGVLVPRMTSAQRTAIVSPAEGLLVYDTDTDCFWVFKISLWVQIISGAPTVSTKTTNYTLTTADNGSILEFNSASDVTLTVPTGLPTGFQCSITQLGAGHVVVSGSGVTIRNAYNYTKSATQYSKIGIEIASTGNAILSGDAQ